MYTSINFQLIKNMKVLYIVLFCLNLVYIKSVAQVTIDTSFVYKVHQPIFNGKKRPVICIDEFHNNLHQKRTGFRPLSNLLENFGFTVNAINKPLDNVDVLKNCDILVIANPIHQNNRGRWYNPTFSAFTESEIKTINEWVKNGGSLLLIADHMPFAGAAKELASAFNIELVNGFTGINPNNWPPSTFKVDYKNNREYKNYFPADTVASFTGSAIKFANSNYSLLNLTTNDTIFVSDTAWVFDNKTTYIKAQGYSQGGILKYGKGTLGVFAEAAMFTAQKAGNTKVGFNSPLAKNNVYFILNVFLSLVKSPDGFDSNYLLNCEKQLKAENL